MSAKILLIEDDNRLSHSLHLSLAKHGFQVEIATEGLAGLQKAYMIQPDVILLNIMLPDLDGWCIYTRLRQIVHEATIIVLTGLGSSKDVIEGLNMGADDYLIKPLKINELVARIQAMLRRVPQAYPKGNGGYHKQMARYDNLIIDLNKHEVVKDGQPIDLSPTEFRLLSLLVHFEGRVLPHNFLLKAVWGEECAYQSDYIRLYISYLRQKLEKDPSNPTLIHSEWGIGYRFG